MTGYILHERLRITTGVLSDDLRNEENKNFKEDKCITYWEKRSASEFVDRIIDLSIFKSSNEDETAFRVLISNVSGFIPCFISIIYFSGGEDYTPHD